MTEWRATTLGALLRQSGGSIKTGPFGTVLKAAEYSSSGVPVVSVGEVGYGRLRIGEATPRLGPAVVRRLPEYVLRTGDIVFGRKGAVDRSARVLSSEDGYFLGSDGIRVRFGAGVDPRFMVYQMQAAQTRAWLMQNAVGTTMASLNQDVLLRVPVRVPAIEEQRAVGQILDDADAFILSLEGFIAKKQAIKQGMMQQFLTGKTRLPGFTGPWHMVRLVELGQCVRGVGYDPHTDLSPGDRPTTMRLLRANNVQNGAIVVDDLQFVHERRVNPRQVLHRGDIVIFDRFERGLRYTFGAFMGVFRVSIRQCDARFVAELLSTAVWKFVRG